MANKQLPTLFVSLSMMLALLVAVVADAADTSEEASAAAAEELGLDEGMVKCHACLAAIDLLWDRGVQLRTECEDRYKPHLDHLIAKKEERKKRERHQLDDDIDFEPHPSLQEEGFEAVTRKCDRDTVPLPRIESLTRKVCAAISETHQADVSEVQNEIEGFRFRRIESSGKRKEKEDKLHTEQDSAVLQRACEDWLIQKNGGTRRIAEGVFTSLGAGRDVEGSRPHIRRRFCFMACGRSHRREKTHRHNYEDEL